MKFGKSIKELAEPSHLHHYIAYDVLKKAINVVVAAQTKEEVKTVDIKADLKAVNEEFGESTSAISVSGLRPPDSRFHSLLQHELAKVNRFAALQIRTLLDTLREAQRPLLHCDGKPSDEALTKAEQLFDAAADVLVSLEQFRRLNFTGFRKIVKKFDKRSREAGMGNYSLASWFVWQLRREPFVATSLDAHFLALAWGYAIIRRHRRGGAALPTAQGQSQGSSCTRTFWLMPQARVRALCTLMKGFDLVVPPNGTPFDPVAESADALMEQHRRLLLSMGPDGMAKMPCCLRAETAMVYHDGPGFPAYVQRVRQSDNAGPSGFRTRSATAVATGGGEIVERDRSPSALGVHAFTPVSVLRTPDAFQLRHSEGSASSTTSTAPAALRAASAAVLAGTSMKDAASLGEEGVVALEGFAKEVDSAVGDMHPLMPVATVCSERWLLSGDTSATQGVSIALHEDVCFSSGADIPDMFSHTTEEAIDFPYCLLEVATTYGETTSQWLTDLRSHAALCSVDGFSVGTHAVAALHKEQVPELPHWYQHLSTVESSEPPETWGLAKELQDAMLDEEAVTNAAVAATAIPEALAVSPESSPKKEIVVLAGGEPAPVKQVTGSEQQAQQAQQLEPKNFLASERTMLEWMHTVLGLTFVGIGLWRVSLKRDVNPQLVFFGLLNTTSISSLALGCYSLFLVLIAIVFAWYAVFTHTRRIQALLDNTITESIFNSRTAPVIFAVVIGMALAGHLVVQSRHLWAALASSQ